METKHGIKEIDVSSIPFFRSITVTKVAALTTGKNNLNFRVYVGDNSFFLKIFDASEVQEINRQLEYSILQRVYDAGLGIRPIAIDLETRSIVTEFVDLPMWTIQEIQVDFAIQKLGRLLREINGMPPVNHVCLTQQLLQRYWNLLSGSENIEDITPFYEQTQKRLNEFYRKDDIKFCHNDFYYENLLRGEESFVLDWELAGMNDFHFDLAVFIHFHNLDKQKIELFLSAYAKGSVSSISINREKLSVHQDAVLLRELLWVNTKLQEGHPDPFYLDYQSRCLSAVMKRQEAVQ